MIDAENGASALAVARAERPDLIVLDVMLPDLDGWQVAEELAAEPETAAIPILFVSARSERADQERAYALGGVGYLTKPFDPEVITRRVADTLDRIRRGEGAAVRAEWRAALDVG